MESDTLARVRAAIKDRATWFALLYNSFWTALPAARVEALARKAIREYGRYKGRLDEDSLDAWSFLEQFRWAGSAAVLDD